MSSDAVLWVAWQRNSPRVPTFASMLFKRGPIINEWDRHGALLELQSKLGESDQNCRRELRQPQPVSPATR